MEVLEARWLFDVPIDQIEVVIHRESIIHSMVEFADRSVVAQLSYPSMKHPIQYALTYPDRLASPEPALSFADLAQLTFGVPDEEAFPCLALAKRAGREGGIMPTVLNAANEVAVSRFLRGEIGFLEIPDIVGRAMGQYKNIPQPTLSELIAADRAVRQESRTV